MKEYEIAKQSNEILITRKKYNILMAAFIGFWVIVMSLLLANFAKLCLKENIILARIIFIADIIFFVVGISGAIMYWRHREKELIKITKEGIYTLDYIEKNKYHEKILLWKDIADIKIFICIGSVKGMNDDVMVVSQNSIDEDETRKYIRKMILRDDFINACVFDDTKIYLFGDYFELKNIQDIVQTFITKKK